MEHSAMTEQQVTILLNQQQLELIDRTIARGISPDRESLVRRALREYAAKHPPHAQSGGQKTRKGA
jgi:metal-responsive CopG/Arc/MetJ family transcriptional regulator